MTDSDDKTNTIIAITNYTNPKQSQFDRQLRIAIRLR